MTTLPSHSHLPQQQTLDYWRQFAESRSPKSLDLGGVLIYDVDPPEFFRSVDFEFLEKSLRNSGESIECLCIDPATLDSTTEDAGKAFVQFLKVAKPNHLCFGGFERRYSTQQVGLPEGLHEITSIESLVIQDFRCSPQLAGSLGRYLANKKDLKYLKLANIFNNELSRPEKRSLLESLGQLDHLKRLSLVAMRLSDDELGVVASSLGVSAAATSLEYLHLRDSTTNENTISSQSLPHLAALARGGALKEICIERTSRLFKIEHDNDGHPGGPDWIAPTSPIFEEFKGVVGASLVRLALCGVSITPGLLAPLIMASPSLEELKLGKPGYGIDVFANTEQGSEEYNQLVSAFGSLRKLDIDKIPIDALTALFRDQNSKLKELRVHRKGVRGFEEVLTEPDLFRAFLGAVGSNCKIQKLSLSEGYGFVELLIPLFGAFNPAMRNFKVRIDGERGEPLDPRTKAIFQDEETRASLWENTSLVEVDLNMSPLRANKFRHMSSLLPVVVGRNRVMAKALANASKLGDTTLPILVARYFSSLPKNDQGCGAPNWNEQQALSALFSLLTKPEMKIRTACSANKCRLKWTVARMRRKKRKPKPTK